MVLLLLQQTFIQRANHLILCNSDRHHLWISLFLFLSFSFSLSLSLSPLGVVLYELAITITTHLTNNWLDQFVDCKSDVGLQSKRLADKFFVDSQIQSPIQQVLRQPEESRVALPRMVVLCKRPAGRQNMPQTTLPLQNLIGSLEIRQNWSPCRATHISNRLPNKVWTDFNVHLIAAPSIWFDIWGGWPSTTPGLTPKLNRLSRLTI